MEDLESVRRETDVYDPAEKGSPGLKVQQKLSTDREKNQDTRH